MNTKLIAALAIVAVLAVAAVGIAAAQIATTTPSPTGANGAPYNGFWGWMGRCLGFKNTYATSAAPANPTQPALPANKTVTDPYTNQTTTYQGYYGYGPCMRGFIP